LIVRYEYRAENFLGMIHGSRLTHSEKFSAYYRTLIQRSHYKESQLKYWT